MSTVISQASTVVTSATGTSRFERMWRSFRRTWQLYLLIVFPVIWTLIFSYLPMWGIQIAFKNYNLRDGINGSPWVGMKNFYQFFDSYQFWPLLRHTLVLNIYSLIAGFPLPIILALSLNYVNKRWFKQTVQMVSYAPHFISTVVIVGLLFQFVDVNGLVNQLLGLAGIGPIRFMSEVKYWDSLYVWSGVWQSVGWGAIIYLAALAGIDPTLHEAAIVDGATKVQRMRDIDLPGIIPVAVILLILNMGGLLRSGFEKVILMQNSLNTTKTEVIDSYVYHIGLQAPLPQYSFATAIGLFSSLIGLLLLFAANAISRRVGDSSLW
ncbi:MAG: ABC transporter permease subunit [Thermomicrobiales bacterium]